MCEISTVSPCYKLVHYTSFCVYVVDKLGEHLTISFSNFKRITRINIIESIVKFKFVSLTLHFSGMHL